MSKASNSFNQIVVYKTWQSQQAKLLSAKDCVHKSSFTYSRFENIFVNANDLGHLKNRYIFFFDS